METSGSRIVLTFLVNALWQVPLIAAVALLAVRGMGRSFAWQRHLVLLAAMAASLAVPLASIRRAGPSGGLPLPDPYSRNAATVASPGQPAGKGGAPAAAAPLPKPVTLPFRAAFAVAAAYALVLLGALLRFVLEYRRTRRIRARARVQRLPPLVEQVRLRCLRAFRLGDVPLLVSPGGGSPLTVGARRPVVILPERLLEESSEAVLAAAIGHEMAHVARRDYLTGILCRLMALPIAFHPAAWLLRGRLEETREMACDELVAGRWMDAGLYARSIVKIAAGLIPSPRAGCALGVFDGDILEERIRRLLDGRKASVRRGRALFAAGLLALAACAAAASGVALAARAQENQAKQNDALQRAGELLEQFPSAQGSTGGRVLAEARELYRLVLASDPWNKQALQGMVTIAMNARRPEEGVEWAAKLIQADPRDKTTHYTAAVLDWAIVYEAVAKAREAAGVAPAVSFLPDADLRARLRQAHGARIEEAMRLLETALTIDPSFDDAMAYLNLMFRLKASMAENQGEAAGYIAQADEWIKKALAEKSRHPGQGRPSTVGPPPPPPPPPGMDPKLNRPADDSATPGPAGAHPGTYWQVIARDPQTPAKALFEALRRRGFQVAYLQVPPENERVRVMAGPYFTAAAADQAKQDLIAAGFHPLRLW